MRCVVQPIFKATDNTGDLGFVICGLKTLGNITWSLSSAYYVNLDLVVDVMPSVNIIEKLSIYLFIFLHCLFFFIKFEEKLYLVEIYEVFKFIRMDR